MSIKTKLQEDLKAAMKAGDKVRVNALRMVLAQIKDAEIDKGGELTEDDEIAVLTSAVKKRKEAIGFYERGDRADLLEQERKELEFISAYLPEPLSEAEIEALVSQAIAEVGASSLKEMGKVMSVVMPQVKGRAEGKLVQEIVRKKLS